MGEKEGARSTCELLLLVEITKWPVCLYGRRNKRTATPARHLERILFLSISLSAAAGLVVPPKCRRTCVSCECVFQEHVHAIVIKTCWALRSVVGADFCIHHNELNGVIHSVTRGR